MLRSIFFGLIFYFLSISVNAQVYIETQKKVICAPMDKLIEILSSEEFKETPFWIGRDIGESSEYILFVNERTKTFTILQVMKNYGCIMGMGTESNSLIQKL